MKHHNMITLISISIIISLTGCASKVISEPSNVTLVEAMKSVGEGISEMRTAQGKIKTGLVPDLLEITFNISASGKQDGKLTIDLAPTSTLQKVNGSAGSSYEANRSNQIKIRFKNILFADTSKTILRDQRISDGKMSKIIGPVTSNLVAESKGAITDK